MNKYVPVECFLPHDFGTLVSILPKSNGKDAMGKDANRKSFLGKGSFEDLE